MVSERAARMITVRNAREDDVPALVDIGVRAWEQAVVGVADLQVRRDYARNAFQQFLAELGYTVVEETHNPAYTLFLGNAEGAN